ncbi:MAG: glycine cleavage system aminomethyltransferase GcvT [Thermoleophilaceae bacterium]
MALVADTLRHTPLHDRHVAAGARLAPFAGWEMPIQYEGVRQEHVTVRRAAGIFDVSHMGEVEVRGAAAEAFLQRVLSNDIARIPPGGAQYSVMCREDGGVLDDLFAYRLADRFLIVTNASNHVRDFDWLVDHARDFDVELRDVADDYAMIALQGPRARALLEEHMEGEAPRRMRVTEARVAGVDCLVCGTGYTGEDGVELLMAPAGAAAVWDALAASGAVACGLAARDTLRLEVCFHLYGNDLSEERGPIEAGLGWCCKPETGFIGADALVERPHEQLVPFAFTGPGIPRPGNPVSTPSGPGVVTSGTFSPCLEIGIGMAYVPSEAAVSGTEIEIDVRGRHRSAQVRERPLYKKDD